MKYLLDTCTVSDFVKGQAGVLARIKATPPSLISVSVITRMEIESGLQLNPDRARKLAPILNDFLAAVTTLAFSEADAMAAAAGLWLVISSALSDLPQQHRIGLAHHLDEVLADRGKIKPALDKVIGEY